MLVSLLSQVTAVYVCVYVTPSSSSGTVSLTYDLCLTHPVSTGLFIITCIAPCSDTILSSIHHNLLNKNVRFIDSTGDYQGYPDTMVNTVTGPDPRHML